MLKHLALSDNGFLFDTRTGHTYSLSTTGTFLLKELIEDADGPPASASLVERLVARFQVDADTARRDVEQFLFRVRDMGLIPKADPSDDRDAPAAGARS